MNGLEGQREKDQHPSMRHPRWQMHTERGWDGASSEAATSLLTLRTRFGVDATGNALRAVRCGLCMAGWRASSIGVWAAPSLPWERPHPGEFAQPLRSSLLFAMFAVSVL